MTTCSSNLVSRHLDSSQTAADLLVFSCCACFFELVLLCYTLEKPYRSRHGPCSPSTTPRIDLEPRRHKSLQRPLHSSLPQRTVCMALFHAFVDTDDDIAQRSHLCSTRSIDLDLASRSKSRGNRSQERELRSEVCSAAAGEGKGVRSPPSQWDAADLAQSWLRFGR